MSAPWISTLPFTYQIGYEPRHHDNSEWFGKIRKGQPDLAHVFHEVPLISWLGSTESADDVTLEPARCLDPEEIPKRIEINRRLAEEARQAGARRIIPYVCTMIMLGNPESRTGFWAFYDRWEEFEHLGLGLKPVDDPVEWVQTGPNPLRHPDLHYIEATISQPGWRRFIRTCVDLVGQCGYDGVFLDVNTLVGFTKYDHEAFREYLTERYTQQQLSDLFGFDGRDQVELGRPPEEEPGGGLLWVETQRFRSWAFGHFFDELRKAGEAHREGFFVIVNGSPIASIQALWDRRMCGQGLALTGPPVHAVMFEEMKQPGRFGMDRINDHVLQYKLASAYGVTGVVLSYHATHSHAIDLCNAEAAAGGGGAFVQPGFGETDGLSAWGKWFTAHSERLDGLQSVHDVGIVFFAEQAWWDNADHMRGVYRLRQALSDAHVLFDFLVEPNFAVEALRTFRVVIVPGVTHLSDDQVGALHDYVSGGGHVLIVGECGTFDELGRERATALCHLLADHVGTSTVCDLDELVPRRDIELFELTEEQCNDAEYCLSLPDRVPSQEEAQSERDIPLIPLLEGLARQGLPLLIEAPYTLRVSAFEREDHSVHVVHVLNYDIEVRGASKSDPPCSVRDIKLRIPGVKARWWAPDGSEGVLAPNGDGFVIPVVKAYMMIEIVQG